MTADAQQSDRAFEASLQRLASPEVLRRAWDHVHRRGSGPGIDRVTVARYAERIEERLVQLGRRLRTNSYRPRPGLRVKLSSDPERRLVIPTVEDRVVQRAIADVLTPQVEPTLSESSWAYRPGRSVQRALARVEHELALGRTWFARTDVAKFFDRIDRNRLMEVLRQAEIDPDLLVLIDRIHRAGCLEGAAVVAAEEGIPQGSALSPLLSNLYLQPLDEAIEAAGFPYFRYADDILVLAETGEQTADALGLLADRLAGLRLELNLRKTRRGRVDQGFDYLGARFDETGRRFSSGARRALNERAERALGLGDDGGTDGPLVELVAEWEHWYGSVRCSDIDDLPLLTGCVLRAVTQNPGERLVRLARRRLELVHCTRRPASTHVVLTEGWVAAEANERAGMEFIHRAALLDARLALEQNTSDRLMGRLGRALGLSRAALQELATSPDGHVAASILAGRGHLELADAAKTLAAGLRGADDGVGSATGDLVGRLEEAALDTLLARLRGRHRSHCCERRDQRGHYRFVEVARPLERADVRQHLEGEARRGFFVVDRQGELRTCAIHVYVDRRAMRPPWTEAPETDTRRSEMPTRWCQLVDRTHQHAARLVRAARELGLHPLVEDTGAHGRRVWLLFDGGVLLRHGFLLLQRLLSEAGEPPPGVRWQAVPSVDRVSRGSGPRLALPLGIHPRSGHRSHFVDRSGRFLADSVRVLKDAVAADPSAVRELVRVGPRHPVARARRRATVLTTLSECPAVGQVLEGCGVLRLLAEKAQRLGHLEPDERATLFEALGHLPGDEAIPALCRLLSPCGHGREDRVRKRVATLGEYPISCPRLARRHARLKEESGCRCSFRGLWGRCYPTPVLHTLRPWDIPAFRERMRKAQQERRAKKGGADRVAEEGRTEAAGRPSNDAVAPGAYADQLFVAPLPGTDRPTAGTETSRPSSSDGSAGRGDEATESVSSHRFDAALRRLQELKKRLDEVVREVSEAERELDQLFESVETDRVRIEHGWLVRRRDGDQRTFIVEI